MASELTLLVLGWLLGLVSSITAGLVMFWLEGKREIRTERLKQRREDTRRARNWAKAGKKESLRGFDLAGANLSGKDLSGADLEDTDFEGARMWATNLSGANLIGASFRRAVMKGVLFNKANLHSADFTGAVVIESDFTGANLRRTRFRLVKRLERCIWRSARVDETTEMNMELRLEIERQLSPENA